MGTPTKYEYNFDTGNDATGDGSPGNPYKTVQGALDDITQGVGGDEIVPQNNTADTTSAPLSLATYGTPSESQPLWIGDASGAVIGDIDGGGTNSIFDSTSIDFLHFVYMRLHNTGSNRIVQFNNHCSVIGCIVENTTADAIEGDDNIYVRDTYLYNIGGIGIRANIGFITQCTFRNHSTNKFSTVCQAITRNLFVVEECIFFLDGSTVAIHTDTGTIARHNSIYYNTGTGDGILTVSGERPWEITSNIIEGISTTNGDGFDITDVFIYGKNAAYNNDTDYDVSGHVVIALGDNEILLESPFNAAGSDDLTIKDIGNLRAGGYPTDNYPDVSIRGYRDKGALQSQVINNARVRGLLTGGRL